MVGAYRQYPITWSRVPLKMAWRTRANHHASVENMSLGLGISWVCACVTSINSFYPPPHPPDWGYRTELVIRLKHPFFLIPVSNIFNWRFNLGRLLLAFKIFIFWHLGGRKLRLVGLFSFTTLKNLFKRLRCCRRKCAGLRRRGKALGNSEPLILAIGRFFCTYLNV